MSEDLWKSLMASRAEVERLRFSLIQIAKMKPTKIADGLVHGPALLLANCQRIARKAIAKPRRMPLPEPPK